MKKVDIISFHPGRQHNFEQALQISRRFSNFRHVTSLFVGMQWVERIGRLSAKAGAMLAKRSAAVDSRFVDVNPVPELKLLFNRNAGKNLNGVHYQERNALFQQWLVKQYAPPRICIGYDTSSWIAFEKWKNKSVLILDLSIAVPQYKLSLARQMGFGQEMIDKLTQGDAITIPAYEKELALADLILCGSEFVRASCVAQGVDPKRLKVIPYGTDLNRFLVPRDPAVVNAPAIKIAFVGAFGYRKGADVLLKVWGRICSEFPNVSLHVYGGVQVPVPEGAERIHLHGFVNQDKLIEELRGAHISVLPTFFEGSSLAVFQSMALGLAVVTTPNAGSIIEDGRNGLIVPYGSEQALYDALRRLVTDAGFRNRVARQAQQDVQEYTWDTYGQKLNRVLSEILQGSGMNAEQRRQLLKSDHQ